MMDIHDIHLSLLMHEGFTGETQGGWIHTELSLVCSQHAIVRVDCSGLEIDAVVWNRSIARLGRDRSQGAEQGLGALILKGLTLDSTHNLWLALYAEVALYNDVRNCCVLMEADDGLIYIFGKQDGTVKQTFEDLMACGELSSSHLASMNGLSLNAASSRLKALYDLGLCHREPRSDHALYFNYLFVGEGLKS